jgi:predicted nucleic acid-binding protein
VVAVDTNILVRLLTRDSEAEYKASHRLFSTEELFVPDTVVLETEWVLRFAFDLQPAEICDAFRKVFGLKNVHLTNGSRVAQAIAWHEAGLDFSDAFHLALSHGMDSLKTFDKDFIKRAKGCSECRVEKPG